MTEITVKGNIILRDEDGTSHTFTEKQIIHLELVEPNAGGKWKLTRVENE